MISSKLLYIVAVILIKAVSVDAQKNVVDEYSVVWNEPGIDYKSSMPIGNGDIGLNVWTEENGDIVFLIGKTDAWTENAQLVKLGRVRVKFSVNPFLKGAAFSQILSPRLGEVLISGNSGAHLRVWVDAYSPVIHMEMESSIPVLAKATVELWRTLPRVTLQNGVEIAGTGVFRELNNLPERRIVIDPDTVLPAKKGQLSWLHHNDRSTYPLVFENQHLASLLRKYKDPLFNRNFGVAMTGTGMEAIGNQTLKSKVPQRNIRIDLYALTQQSDIVAWQKGISKIVAKGATSDIEKARKAHRKWWQQFWNRSWIKVSGDADAEKVTQGYAMQRWMCGASGRGVMPIKYNGSIFTVGQEPSAGKLYDSTKGQQDADYRAWGGNLWFQNQRLLYWPMIAAGDTDLLMPFINMYVKALPLAKDRTKLYFNHEGACFPETIYFWGLPNNNDFGWGNKDIIIKNTWIRHYVTGGLELTAMMLDYYAITQDTRFLESKLLPIATEITTYYDQHWERIDGKIRMEPSQALETRQITVNDAPDIAGLIYVLPRLLALPENSTTATLRKMWQKTLADLPVLPRGHTDSTGKNPLSLKEMTSSGKEILLTAESFSKTNNVENPELYAVFPFGLFGTQLPEIEVAVNTYNARRFKSSTCWGQDGIQAACLGLTEIARKEVTANFTMYGGEKFRWFWTKGHDWEPDMDNGGAGQVILQNMLLQSRGDKMLLFPAWPKEWNVDFKLYAPKNTIIEGSYKNGKLSQLKVTPESRKRDIVNMLATGN